MSCGKVSAVCHHLGVQMVKFFLPPGAELYFDSFLNALERWCCRILGAPIVGLGIRLWHLARLLPERGSGFNFGCGLRAGCHSALSGASVS